MKSCTHYEESLAAFVDGELRGAMLEEFTAHMESCAACTRQVSAQQTVKQLVQDRISAVQAPAQLRMDIIRLIEGLQVPRGFLARRVVLLSLRPVTAYAAAATLLLCLVGAWLGGMEYQQSVQAAVVIPAVETLDAAQPAFASMDGVQAINGKLICVGCTLKQVHGADFDCRSQGHSMGIRTDDGALWSIIKNDGSSGLFLDMTQMNQQVRVKGTFFANAHFINVDEYEIIPGD
jgi:mycothiol system anti-sigma-R factor